MKLSEFYTLNNKRTKTEKGGQIYLRHEEDTSKGFHAKKLLNNLQTSLMMFSPKYFNTNIERDQIIQPWNYGRIKSSNKCQQKALERKQQSSFRQQIIAKKELSSIKSEVIKNKTKISEAFDMSHERPKRQKLKTQQPQKVHHKSFKIEQKQMQKKTPKSFFFLKRVDILIKIKDKNRKSNLKRDEKQKSLSKDKGIKIQKLPKLQKAMISSNLQSRKIVIPNHSSLYNQLQELNKLISSQSVLIKQRVIF